MVQRRVGFAAAPNQDDLDDPHDQRLLGVLGVLEEEKEIIGEEINEGEEGEKIIELVDDQGAVGGAGAAGVGGGGGGGAAARVGGEGMVEEEEAEEEEEEE